MRTYESKRKIIILAAIILVLGGCGSGADEAGGGDEAVVVTQAEAEAKVEAAVPETEEEDTAEPEIAGEAEEPISEEAAETTPEPIPEAATEPEVEMVDWETWASQDNTDIYLVVWNDQAGKQTIVENGKTYEREEGDRFAIPNKENIIGVALNGKPVSLTESAAGSYYEILPQEGDRNNIIVKFSLEDGTWNVKTYSLK